MKINYKDGTLEIYLHELLENVVPEKRVEMIESLACDDEIIRHVADQIIHRWTENSCSGGSNCTIPADSEKGTPLDHAWRRVAKASSDVAKDQIERLERGLAQRDEQISTLHKEIRTIYEKRERLQP
jgi:hypothetical protein